MSTDLDVNTNTSALTFNNSQYNFNRGSAKVTDGFIEPALFKPRQIKADKAYYSRLRINLDANYYIQSSSVSHQRWSNLYIYDNNDNVVTSLKTLASSSGGWLIFAVHQNQAGSTLFLALDSPSEPSGTETVHWLIVGYDGSLEGVGSTPLVIPLGAGVHSGVVIQTIINYDKNLSSFVVQYGDPATDGALLSINGNTATDISQIYDIYTNRIYFENLMYIHYRVRFGDFLMGSALSTKIINCSSQLEYGCLSVLPASYERSYIFLKDKVVVTGQYSTYDILTLINAQTYEKHDFLQWLAEIFEFNGGVFDNV